MQFIVLQFHQVDLVLCNMFITSKRLYKQVWFQTNTKTYSAGGNVEIGFSGFPTNIVDKATYATEITSVSNDSALVTARFSFASCGNTENGIVIGGYTMTASLNNTAEKTAYSTDITSLNPSADLPVQRIDIMALGNATNMYSYGGSSTENAIDCNEAYTTVYATNVTSAKTSANLPNDRAWGATLNSVFAGMYLGGFASSSLVKSSTSYKMPFTTETTSTVASLALITATAQNRGLNADLNKNGYITSDNGVEDWMKVNYQTDVVSSLASTQFPVATAENRPFQYSGHSNRTTGYTMGGYSVMDQRLTAAYKMPFATETVSSVPTMNKSVAASLVGGYG